MSRTLGLLVTHNEADRYLQSVLEHNAPLLDDLLILDDRSTDGTADITCQYGTTVVRPEGQVGFTEHEGKFRALGWHYLADRLSPEFGDVIISFDADEYLLADDLTAFEGPAARVAVDECWKVRDGRPMVRTDKAWSRIDDVRAWHWQPGLQVEAGNQLIKGRAGRSNKKDLGAVASGCGPYQTIRVWHDGLRILHVGYLDEGDRRVKQERYRSDGRHGSAHIQSITERPRLNATAHEVVIWRGLKGTDS